MIKAIVIRVNYLGLKIGFPVGENKEIVHNIH